MAHRPEVFVRPLTMEEGRKLQRITRSAKDPVKLRRAIVVMMSGQGQSVPDITSLMQVSDDYVRDVIHAFNEKGFDALRYYALNGTDHRTHDEQNAALGAYVRWRNARAEPKTSFAASSPIRSWTSYPAKVG
ncbi:helix-turn-helix domain-containing protein [Microtetraspora sp. NBRC 16547]|uniref:helix-turn-helix domain-containing protein n=1 Tax=Microtetraspora sp. NBRC 16547 TaxID=3030993 RepID=UPI002555FCCA|nr:helix-turn-helix domain-containing protein [Microtetraspora sp. NBRC 16547]